MNDIVHIENRKIYKCLRDKHKIILRFLYCFFLPMVFCLGFKKESFAANNVTCQEHESTVEQTLLDNIDLDNLKQLAEAVKNNSDIIRPMHLSISSTPQEAENGEYRMKLGWASSAFGLGMKASAYGEYLLSEENCPVGFFHKDTLRAVLSHVGYENHTQEILEAMETVYPRTKLSYLRDLPIVSVSINDYEMFDRWYGSRKGEDVLCEVLNSIDASKVEKLLFYGVQRKTERFIQALKRFNPKIIRENVFF